MRSRPVVGVLHPGVMGAALGSALKHVAGAVIWAAAGRSDATAKRAELADLVGVPDLAELARRSDVIISVCPPDRAWELAQDVAAALADRADRPLVVDANAVAPDTVRGIGELLGADSVVDAAVIGPPARQAGRAVLWLSGVAAGAVAGLFEDSPFPPRVLGDELGAASALKACDALRSAVLPALWWEMAAAARGFGVEGALREELARAGVDYRAQVLQAAEGVATAGSRRAGELDGAAEAVAALGLPDGFCRAAAQVYRRLADGDASGITSGG